MDTYLYVIYTIIFIMGCLNGSFCTLAVYRIPIGKDITHERSFCPNCNHKLGFLDLIPVLSYIFLRGKCRYCGQKIRIRYLILEIASGTLLLLYALSLNMNIKEMSLDKIIGFFFGMMYITSIMIIAGIDKEKKYIQRSVLLFGAVLVFIYILYLSIVGNANIDRYAIYLFFMFAYFCINICDNISKKQRKKAIGFYICICNLVAVIAANFVM
ncbi:MAG: prepilin peptidase [Clostridia bacterium]|nr:prepilin peptidase [Clostridia bacterium]